MDQRRPTPDISIWILVTTGLSWLDVFLVRFAISTVVRLVVYAATEVY